LIRPTLKSATRINPEVFCLSTAVRSWCKNTHYREILKMNFKFSRIVLSGVRRTTDTNKPDVYHSTAGGQIWGAGFGVTSRGAICEARASDIPEA
jgi:hypothetical protein